MSPNDLSHYPVHLGLGANAVVEPAFTGDAAWYGAYGERHAADGAEGRLVSMFTFHEPWTSWEMHPNGHEVVVCVSGRMVLTKNIPTARARKSRSRPASTRSIRQASGTQLTFKEPQQPCSSP